MRRRCGIWLAGTILILVAACSMVPENTYFTMAYTLVPEQTEPARPLPVSVRVRELEVTPAYDKERIVYRFSPYEYKYYNYMLWAVKPQRMVTEMMIRHFEDARLFANISREFGDIRPDYELSGVLQAIEEIDSGDEWYAHIEFTLRVSRYSDGAVIWSHRVDAKKKVYNKSPVYVVKALSELMEAEMTKIVDELRTLLSGQQRGGNP
ncbi:MAG: membrane integrity-associated transporter subunit PqiC [Deltaproteobacteria bacterium]|nr:membrane integrity-associated transporter subunit PqiC [Deltaproteobacteria bacterium]